MSLTESADASASGAPLEANIWVTIYPDNSIVVKYGATEFDQGSMTHISMMLAEHLDADWDKVEVEIVKVHDTDYGNPVFMNWLYTAGSRIKHGCASETGIQLLTGVGVRLTLKSMLLPAGSNLVLRPLDIVSDCYHATVPTGILPT